MILYLSAEGDGRAIGCDTCGDWIEPGARIDEPGPWNAYQAERAAESRGWEIDADGLVVCNECLAILGGAA